MYLMLIFEAGGGWYQNTLNSIGFRLRTIELHEVYTADTNPTSFPHLVADSKPASHPASNLMYLMLIFKLVEADIKTHQIQSDFDKERWNSMRSTQLKQIRRHFRFRSSPAHLHPPAPSHVFNANFEAGWGWYQSTKFNLDFMRSTQPKQIRHHFRFRSSPARQPLPNLHSPVFSADFKAGGRLMCWRRPEAEMMSILFRLYRPHEVLSFWVGIRLNFACFDISLHQLQNQH